MTMSGHLIADNTKIPKGKKQLLSTKYNESHMMSSIQMPDTFILSPQESNQLRPSPTLCNNLINSIGNANLNNNRNALIAGG